MRPCIVAPLPRPEMAESAAHIVVRDYPETLAIFRRFGVDLPVGGGERVMDLIDGDTGPLLDALAETIEWRNASEGELERGS